MNLYDESHKCDKRCEIIAAYIIKSGCTVREAAQYFNIGKSTVHKDVTYHLKNIDQKLYNSVRVVLERNKAERHLRGGSATKQKFMKKQNALNTPEGRSKTVR